MVAEKNVLPRIRPDEHGWRTHPRDHGSRKAEVKPQNTLNTPTLVSVAVSVQ
jgi:hypothetical protein